MGPSKHNKSGNVLLGYQAGYSTTTGSDTNVFLGYQAGYNETGSNKLYIENSNSLSPLIYGEFDNNLLRVNGTLDINNAYRFPTVAGTNGQVLQTDDSGVLSWTAGGATDINGLTDGKTDGWSVFLGSDAGTNDDGTANANVGVGISALYSNTTGYDNTANGYKSLFSNETGHHNTANGHNSLYYNTAGNYNTANGFKSLNKNITGFCNTANGYLSLYSNTTGFSNTAIGTHTLFENTTRSNLVAIGDSALFNNGTGATGDSEAKYNTAIGSKSLYSNITGYANTANGYQSLYTNTTGYSNTAIGIRTLYNNTTRSNLVAIGDSALFNNCIGETGAYQAIQNTAIGSKALYENTTGFENTANGYQALYSNTTGFSNTANGYKSLYHNLTGDYNTASGNFAGPAIGSTDLNNTGAFGYNAKPTASNRISIGNFSVSWIGGQVSWSTYSDKRFKRNIKENVSGLDFIMKLRPVTYQWNIRKLNDHIGIPQEAFSDEVMQQAIKDQEANTYTGFLAQEVEKAANESGYDFSGVHAPANEITPYSLSYAEFVVPLVKAVQEQQKMIEELKRQNSELVKRIGKLEER